MPTVRYNISAAGAVQGAAQFASATQAIIRNAQAAANAVQAMNNAMNFGGGGAGAAIANLNNVSNALSHLPQRFRHSAKGASEFTVAMRNLGSASVLAWGPLSGVGSRLITIGALHDRGSLQLAGYVVGLTGLAVAMASSIKAAAEFESGLIAVAKTTGLQGQALADLGAGLESLSTELGIPQKALLDVAEAAGQMGIQSKAGILAFTEVMTQMSRTTNLSATEAAKSIAELLNVTREGPETVRRLGDVITQLGNDMVATESAIVDLALEIGRAGGSFGITAEQASIFAATMKSVGARTESAGSAMNRVFKRIGEAALEGGEKLNRFAKFTQLVGVSAKQFADIASKDMYRATILLFEGMSKAGLSGAQLAKVLDDMKIATDRNSKAIIPMITGFNQLTLAEDSAAKATGALAREFGAVGVTFNRQLEILQQRIEAIRREIGQDFLPTATAFLTWMNSVIRDAPAVADGLQRIVTILSIMGGLVAFKVLARFVSIPGLIAVGLTELALRFKDNEERVAALGDEVYKLERSTVTLEKFAALAERIAAADLGEMFGERLTVLGHKIKALPVHGQNAEDALAGLRNVMKVATGDTNDYAAANDEAAKALEKAASNVKDMNAVLAIEIAKLEAAEGGGGKAAVEMAEIMEKAKQEVLKMTDAEKAAEIQKRNLKGGVEALTRVYQQYGIDIAQTKARTESLVDATEEAAKAKEKLAKATNELLSDLEAQNKLMEIELTQGKEAAAIYEAQAAAADKLNVSISALPGPVNDLILKNRELKKELESMVDVGKAFADSFSQVVTGILQGTRDAKDVVGAFKDTFIGIFSEMFKKTIEEKLLFDFKVKGNLIDLVKDIGSIIIGSGGNGGISGVFKGAFDSVLGDAGGFSDILGGILGGAASGGLSFGGFGAAAGATTGGFVGGPGTGVLLSAAGPTAAEFGALSASTAAATEAGVSAGMSSALTSATAMAGYYVVGAIITKAIGESMMKSSSRFKSNAGKALEDFASPAPVDDFMSLIQGGKTGKFKDTALSTGRNLADPFHNLELIDALGLGNVFGKPTEGTKFRKQVEHFFNENLKGIKIDTSVYDKLLPGAEELEGLTKPFAVLVAGLIDSSMEDMAQVGQISTILANSFAMMGDEGATAIERLSLVMADFGMTLTEEAGLPLEFFVEDTRGLIGAVGELIPLADVLASEFGVDMFGPATLGVKNLELALRAMFAMGKISAAEVQGGVDALAAAFGNVINLIGTTGVAAFQILQSAGIASIEDLKNASLADFVAMIQALDKLGIDGAAFLRALMDAGIASFSELSSASQGEIQGIIDKLNSIPNIEREVTIKEQVVHSPAEGADLILRYQQLAMAMEAIPNIDRSVTIRELGTGSMFDASSDPGFASMASSRESNKGVVRAVRRLERNLGQVMGVVAANTGKRQEFTAVKDRNEIPKDLAILKKEGRIIDRADRKNRKVFGHRSN